jgi:diadenosine tetraphosphate (Ap4A) HIT family hydrolase
MIHPQLMQDCHLIGSFEGCTVLLHRNALVPWFILVPHTELEDVLDLPPQLLGRVTEQCQRLSTFIKRELGYSKINFAGLGNVVPQMHLHIIGRKEGDACWPSPVWGQLSSSTDYDSATIEDWQQKLVKGYELCVTE